MTALAASPLLRLPPARQRRYPLWWVALSVLLHAGLLALVIVAAQHRRPVAEEVPPAPVAMVFEGSGNTTPSIANPAPAKPNQPGSPQPQPATPPVPAPHPAAPMPTPKPSETAPSKPPPATAVPPVTPSAPPEPKPPPAAAAPPVPTLATPEPPVPGTPPTKPQPAQKAGPPPQPVPTQPAPEVPGPAAQLQAPQALPLPPPPPAHPATPRLAMLRPPPAVPAKPSPAFPAPMDFSLGQSAASSEQALAPARRRPLAGTMDLSFAPSLSGSDVTQLHAHGKADTVGPDWFNEVSAWWLRHRFYPNEAARLAPEGDVVLELVVAPSGHVESLELEHGSGSPWLDMGAEAVFRSANLPPLPGNIQDPNITVDFTIHYQIVR